MANEASNWITAGIAAVAAVFAYQSARAAERSAKAAESTQQRAVLRQVVSTAHLIVEEANRAYVIAEDLNHVQTAAAVFTGNVGGSRHELQKKELAASLASIETASADARKLTSQSSALNSTAESELTIALGRLEGHLAQVRGERERLQGQLTELREFIRPIQEQRLTGQT